MRKLAKVGLAIGGLLVVIVGLVIAATPEVRYFLMGAGTRDYPKLAPGPLWGAFPGARDAERTLPPGAEQVRRRIIETWAKQPMVPADAEHRSPRAVLARLAAGKDVAAANALLLQMKPWGNTGSEWDLREGFGFKKSSTDTIRIGHRGDYDFTMTTLTTCLYLFGDDPELLYPETADHIARVLLIETGGKPRLTVPMSLGLVRETENHILMTEGCRYLTNQWLYAHGENTEPYDNEANGLEAWLIAHLTELRNGGFYEFNSRPYLIYSMEALLNLQAFAQSEAVRSLSREIIDASNWAFAFGSLDLRRDVPFRRRKSHAEATDFYTDYLSPMIAAWSGRVPNGMGDALYYSRQGLVASLIPYELPAGFDAVQDAEAFVRIGRGPQASPELYSRAPGFVLSAGGAGITEGTEIIPRRTLLLLPDGADDINACFGLSGQGELHTWNMTGVAPRFACGPGPVHVPAGYEALAEDGDWLLYQVSAGKWWLVVYRASDIGLMALIPSAGENPVDLLENIVGLNPAVGDGRRFEYPGTGRVVTYDVHAPMGTWVIESDDGELMQREWASWPRMDGWLIE